MEKSLCLVFVFTALFWGIMISGREIRGIVPQDSASEAFDGVRRKIAQILKASAAYASVRDVVRFGMFHLGNTVPGQKRILKSATLATMHGEYGSEFMDGDVPVRYLLGSFGQIDYRGYRFHVATGGMPGAVSRLDLIPSENIASAVLANADGVDL